MNNIASCNRSRSSFGLHIKGSSFSKSRQLVPIAVDMLVQYDLTDVKRLQNHDKISNGYAARVVLNGQCLSTKHIT